MIPSYQIKDLYKHKRSNLYVIVEDISSKNIFYQVKLSDEEFNKILKIINKAKDGFLLNTYPEKFTFEPVEE